MAFKGDVGHISLLNIYQALNLNQQGGILVISSGKLKRRIRFVPEGIRLLSNGPGDPEPLRSILIKLRLLTDSQFQNVVSTKNDSTVRTGDFLVQRRLLDPDLVATEISKHALDHIYETFFWKPARYEFNVGEGGDESELFSPDRFGHVLTYRIEGVLMEVARREDEWERIHQKIRSEKEIFIPTDSGAFLRPREYDSELPHTAFVEVKKLINGQRTIETIVQETRFSKYETFRALALLLEENEIRPLTASEKKEIAEKLRKKFKIKEVVDIYEQLLQEDPADLETRLSLIGILEKKKCESALVEHYQCLASHYFDIHEYGQARSFLDKVLAIDPNNLTSREKLFDLLCSTHKDRQAVAEARAFVEAVKLEKAYAAGAATLEKILRLFPDETPLYHDCADFHQFNGSPDDAIRNLKAVAAIYERRNDHTRLRKTFERIASIDPSEKHALRRCQDLERKSSRRRLGGVFPSLAFCGVVLFVVFVAYWTVMEVLCRNAYAAVDKEIDTLVDGGRFDEATGILNRLQKIYPLSSVRWSIAQRVHEITERQHEATLRRRQQQEEKNTHFTSYLAQIATLIRDNRYSDAWTELKSFDRTGLNPSNLKKLEELEEEIRRTFDDADALLKHAESLTKKGNHKEAHEIYVKLLMKYPHTPATRDLEVPLVIRSIPPKADVIVNSKNLGKTPVLVRYNPFRKISLRIRKAGFADFSCGLEDDSDCVEFTRDSSLTVRLTRVPDWTFTAHEIAASSPAVVGGKVLVPTKDGRILALDQAQGRPIWSSATVSEWGIRDAIKQWNGLAYFGTADGRIIALETGKGEAVLKVTPFGDGRKDRVLTSPATPEGVLCVVSGDNIAAFSMVKKVVLWRRTLPSALEQAPLVFKTSFLLCTTEGDIVLLDSYGGTVKKTLHLQRPLSKTGTVAGKSFFVCDNHGLIYRIDLDSGEIVWSYLCERTNLSTPFAGPDAVLVGSDDGYFLSLDLEKGARKWDFKIDDGFPSAGLSHGETFLVASAKGVVACLDPSTGNYHWTYAAEGGVPIQPAIADGRLFVVSDRGTVYAFAME